MKKTVIYIILSGWMLAGCGTYSRYHRPDLSTENLYRDMPADIDTMTIASLSWREMFTDPKLQSLIETGLERNADLNVARLRVEAAEAVLMTARLSYLPSLGQAITKYFNGKGLKLKITAAFDVDPEKVGKTIDGIPCYHMGAYG